MERLNNIIKTAQPRPRVGTEQRPPQPHTFQEQGQEAMLRRPLSESHMHLGQTARGSRIADQQYSYNTRPALPRTQSENTGEEWEEIPAAQPPAARPTYGSQRSLRPARYAERPSRGDYYERTESQHYRAPADAQDDWGDDTAGMRYGDWESAPGYEPPTEEYPADGYTSQMLAPSRQDESLAHRPPARERSPVAQRLAQLHDRGGPLVTRELHGMRAVNTRPPVKSTPGPDETRL